jgi:hypothetical protein
MLSQHHCARRWEGDQTGCILGMSGGQSVTGARGWTHSHAVLLVLELMLLLLLLVLLLQ